jgi:type II secretory pathway predicted ATPase ExeA
MAAAMRDNDIRACQAMYLEFYKLRAPPFQLTPDRKFFFAARQHAKALHDLFADRTIHHGFHVITGEVGAGKTTLLQIMRSKLDGSDACVAQIVTTQLGPDDLLRMLAAQFGIPIASVEPDMLLVRFRDFLTNCCEMGRRVVVFIDETQNLSLSCFEMLFSLMDLEVGGRPLIEIFLLGQPEFRNALESGAMPEVQRRVVSSHHLESLGFEETRGLILHRLRTAGWQGDPSFSKRAYLLIHQLTRGVPRRINLFCNRLLIYTHLEELHQITSAVVFEVIEDARREGLPIGDLSLDTGALAGRKPLTKSDDAIKMAPKPANQLPCARESQPGLARDSNDAIKAALVRNAVVPPGSSPEPERTTGPECLHGSSLAPGDESASSAENSGNRGADWHWRGVARVALPLLSGFCVWLIAGPAGIVEPEHGELTGQLAERATPFMEAKVAEPPAPAKTAIEPPFSEAIDPDHTIESDGSQQAAEIWLPDVPSLPSEMSTAKQSAAVERAAEAIKEPSLNELQMLDNTFSEFSLSDNEDRREPGKVETTSVDSGGEILVERQRHWRTPNSTNLPDRSLEPSRGTGAVVIESPEMQDSKIPDDAGSLAPTVSRMSARQNFLQSPMLEASSTEPKISPSKALVFPTVPERLARIVPAEIV